MSQMKKLFCLISVASLGLVISTTSFGASDLKKALEERIKPVGQMCMEGESCAAAPTVLASADTAKRSGEDIYKSKCFTCHASGVAGAPKFGITEDWVARVGKGIDVLYSSAIHGFNGMPPKGLCMDCSEEELKDSVDYMVKQSQ